MPSNKITSLQNTNIKNVVKLRDRKGRKDSGCTIVEGIKELQSARNSDCVFKEFYLCDDFIDESDKNTIEQLCDNTKTYAVTKEIFEKIAYGNRHEGVLAVVEPKPLSLDDVALAEKPLVVVFERVEKPGNLGAVLRSCDGAKVDLLIICDGLSDLYNPNTIRASLGTIFTVPVIALDQDNTLKFLEDNSIKVCATVPNANALYSQVDLTGPLAFVFGNEHEGLTPFWSDNSDVKIRIPMNGQADSLNVSATAAVLIYEALRQRDG